MLQLATQSYFGLAIFKNAQVRHVALGGGALSVSFLNGMDNLLSAFYSSPGDYPSDRLGCKRALIVFNMIAMAGYVEAKSLL